MVSIIGHTVISVKKEHGILVHGRNNLLDNDFTLYNLPLNLGVVRKESMPSMTDTNKMAHEEIEVLFFIQNVQDIVVDIQIVGIEIANVEAWIVRLFVKKISEHVYPNVVTREDYPALRGVLHMVFDLP